MNLFKYLTLTIFCLSILSANTYLAQDEGSDVPEKPADSVESATSSEETVVPIEFKDEYIVSINLGSTIPFGTNLKNQFTSGMNLKLNFLTPFGFELLSKDFKLLAGLDIMKCTANEGAGYEDYSITSLGTRLVTNISVIDLSIGTGLAMSSGTQMYITDGEYPKYSMTTAFISAGLSYTLPLSGLLKKSDMGNLNFDISNLSISLFIEGMEIFGSPAAEGTSDLINAGIAIGYPILF